MSLSTRSIQIMLVAVINVFGLELIAGRRALLISVNWTPVCTSSREKLQGKKNTITFRNITS